MTITKSTAVHGLVLAGTAAGAVAAVVATPDVTSGVTAGLAVLALFTGALELVAPKSHFTAQVEQFEGEAETAAPALAPLVVAAGGPLLAVAEGALAHPAAVAVVPVEAVAKAAAQAGVEAGIAAAASAAEQAVK